MFGFSVRIATTSDLLIVTVPAMSIVGMVFMPFWLLFQINLFRHVTTSRGRKEATFWVLFCLFIWGVLFTPARVILDAKKGTANISTMMFFIPHHQTLPLSQVQGAMVRFSDQSEAVGIVINGGHSIQLTPFSQQGGTDEAVGAINEFLQEHGGVSSPY